MKNLRFIIVGVGGVGMNIAIQLVQIKEIIMPIKRIDFIDYDIIESSNLNRLPMLNYIGQPKPHALMDFIINNISTDIDMHPYYGDGIDWLNNKFDLHYNDFTILLDCTDRTYIQSILLKTFRKKVSFEKGVYCRVGNENNIVNIEFNSNYAETLKVHEQGYTSTPTNPFYVAGTTYLFFYEIRKYIDDYINNRLSDINVRKRKITYDLDLYYNLNFINHYERRAS